MKILFIAGGLWQKAFVSFLKEKGHTVAIVNPVKNATTALADEHLEVSILEHDKLRKFAATFKPDFVTSDQSDIATTIVSILSHELGLPCNPPQTVAKFSDKALMERAARCLRVPTPDTRIVTNMTAVKKFGSDYKYPIIIKPLDATMSRGFRRFDSPADVTTAAVEESLSFSPQRQLVAQNFVDGDMVTVEGICIDGKHHTLATSIKTGWFAPGINSGVSYPSNLPHDVMQLVIGYNDRFCNSSGLKMGFTHAEYIINGPKVTLIEIGARGGGAGIIDKIVPWVSGVNPYELFHGTITGQKVAAPVVKDPRPAFLKYYKAEDVAGCTEAIAEKIRKCAGVVEFQYDFIGKQYTHDKQDLRHSMGIFVARDDGEMARIVKRVGTMIKG